MIQTEIEEAPASEDQALAPGQVTQATEDRKSTSENAAKKASEAKTQNVPVDRLETAKEDDKIERESKLEEGGEKGTEDKAAGQKESDPTETAQNETDPIGDPALEEEIAADPELRADGEVDFAAELGVPMASANQASAVDTQPDFTLDQLETTHQESLAAYHQGTQKRVQRLKQQTHTALKSCDNTFSQQYNSVASAYDKAIQKVRKSLTSTLDKIAQGKMARKMKLGQLIEAKINKAGYLTLNKQ